MSAELFWFPAVFGGIEVGATGISRGADDSPSPSGRGRGEGERIKEFKDSSKNPPATIDVSLSLTLNPSPAGRGRPPRRSQMVLTSTPLPAHSYSTENSEEPPISYRSGIGSFAGLLLLVLFCGCRSTPPPSVDLSQPVWTVQQGQAVWTVSPAKKGGDGVAGEVLLATQSDGSCWVQFSKPPFNLFTAQRTPQQWHIDFKQGFKRYSGRGAPPSRLIWFQLARAVRGDPVDAPWQFNRHEDNSWQLTNSTTRERLEGYLAP